MNPRRSFKNICLTRTAYNYKKLISKIRLLSTCNICCYRFNSKKRAPLACVNEHYICISCVKSANTAALNSDELDYNLKLKCPWCRQSYKFGYPTKKNRVRNFIQLFSSFKNLIEVQKSYNKQLKRKYLKERNQRLKEKKEHLMFQKTILERDAKHVIFLESPSSPDVIIIDSIPALAPLVIPTTSIISDSSSISTVFTNNSPSVSVIADSAIPPSVITGSSHSVIADPIPLPPAPISDPIPLPPAPISDPIPLPPAPTSDPIPLPPAPISSSIDIPSDSLPLFSFSHDDDDVEDLLPDARFFVN